jgi:aspartate kinase
MALVATVGMGMSHAIGTAARLFAALSKSRVNVRMIDQGSSEQNIIVGVEEADLATAIKAIYAEFA